MTALAVLLCACALEMWPSTVAASRARALGRRFGKRRGRGRLARCCAILLARAWWIPGGVLLLVRPGLGVAALLVAASARASLRARRARLLEQEHTTAAQAALMAVTDELRVGAHPAHAFAAAAEEQSLSETFGGAQTARALREVAARARLGGDVGEGLRRRAAVARGAGLDSVGALWERLGFCWDLSHREGVPMAQVLCAARTDLVERVRFGERSDAALAGARSTAKILCWLPALCVLLGESMGARPLHVLLSGAGSFLLLFGCGFVCAGAAWSRRITSGAGR